MVVFKVQRRKLHSKICRTSLQCWGSWGRYPCALKNTAEGGFWAFLISHFKTRGLRADSVTKSPAVQVVIHLVRMEKRRQDRRQKELAWWSGCGRTGPLGGLGEEQALSCAVGSLISARCKRKTPWQLVLLRREDGRVLGILWRSLHSVQRMQLHNLWNPL